MLDIQRWDLVLDDNIIICVLQNSSQDLGKKLGDDDQVFAGMNHNMCGRVFIDVNLYRPGPFLPREQRLRVLVDREPHAGYAA